MAGLNPSKWLQESDPFERRVMEEIANRRVDIAADERQDLAERIIDVLGKQLKAK